MPAIAEKRILKCKTQSAREELNAAFETTAKVRESVMNTLLTSAGDREMFRKVYPFSPALVQTLIAVSSVLQRERTALKVMMQLLVDHRDTLKVGDVVPVGDLFDVVAHGDEAFSPEMAIHFNNAKRLYQQKLLPELEKKHGHQEDLSPDDPKRLAFRNDDRLVKTLLLSALVPEVESLRNLSAERLANLNHGTIKSPIPGRESNLVLDRCRTWAASIGEIRIGEESSNPTISIQLSGVDTDSILKQAEREDNRGNRIRLIRDMVYAQLNIKGEDQSEQYHDFTWKNTRRSCVVVFGNIWELPDASLENLDDRWKLVIDYPFDEANRSPKDDWQKCEKFKTKHKSGAKTLCWIPSFFSDDAKKDLGTLLILEHVLTGERFTEYATYLSPQDRQTAKSLLENQRSVLTQRMRNHLDAAYGISQSPGAISTSARLELNEQFVSLQPGFDLQPPTAANLANGLQHLLDQAFTHEFPAAPDFETDVSRINTLQKVYEQIGPAAQTADGRLEIDQRMRPLLKQIANPLLLGEMAETHFVLGQHWKNHFVKKIAEISSAPQVSQLRQWIDQPRAMGLSKELQNLIILTYAEQTGRSFFRHNTPFDVTIKDISSDCELREQKLPDEAQWTAAIQRAKDIFGISVTALRKASTVASLETKVQNRATAALESCQSYVQALQHVPDTLNLDQTYDRLTTATTTLALVEQLSAAKAEEVVEVLADCAIATSESAMAECLKKTANLTGTLNATSWDIFEGITALADDRQTQASTLLASLVNTLSSDEHVIALGPSLKTAHSAAVRLLSYQPPQPPPVTPPPVTPPPITPPETTAKKAPTATIPTLRTVSEESQSDLTLPEAETLLAQLSKDLKPGQTIRLGIGWIVQEESFNS